MARAMWKGTIRFDDVSLPVKMYSAVQDRAVHFHLLHDQDMARLQQQMVNTETGKPVESAERRKGFEIERGVFVMLNDDELDSLEPPPSRDINVLHFIDFERVPHQWYDRPYYLGPDENSEDYFSFAAALESLEKEGIAHWVMRKRRYVGSLWAENGYLMLFTLRNSDEVIEAADLDPPKGKSLDKQELRMAGQLIGMLEDEFDSEEYHDEYRQRVLELIETKAKGGDVKLQSARPKKARRKSLADALEESLAAAK